MGAIEELTAALKENSALLKTLSGKTAGAAAADTKPASKTTTKPATKAEEEEAPKRGRGRPPKDKTLSVTEMAEKARAFAEAANDDEDDFKERRALLTKLAKKYGVGKFSEIKGEDQAPALAALKEYEEGEAEDENGDDEGEGDY